MSAAPSTPPVPRLASLRLCGRQPTTAESAMSTSWQRTGVLGRHVVSRRPAAGRGRDRRTRGTRDTRSRTALLRRGTATMRHRDTRDLASIRPRAYPFPVQTTTLRPHTATLPGRETARPDSPDRAPSHCPLLRGASRACQLFSARVPRDGAPPRRRATATMRHRDHATIPYQCNRRRSDRTQPHCRDAKPPGRIPPTGRPRTAPSCAALAAHVYV